MERWIEPGDLPWAASRLARTALNRWRRTGPDESEPDVVSGRNALGLARRNIEATLGDDPARDVEAIVRGHREYVRFRAPTPRSLAAGGRERWPLSGREHLDAALAGGSGAILATAHLGWWLLTAPILRLHGVPVVQTGGPYFERRRRSRNERSRAQSRFRRFMDERTRPPTHLAPEDLAVTLDLRPIFAALARNRAVLIAGDGKRSLEFATFPLLGRPYALPIGFMKIAMAARAPVLPVFALEGERPGTVRVEVGTPLPVDPAAPAVENLALYARVLDNQLRATPHLWSRWGTADPFARRLAWAEGRTLRSAAL